MRLFSVGRRDLAFINPHTRVIAVNDLAIGGLIAKAKEWRKGNWIREAAVCAASQLFRG
jgi:hypothetical protein